MADEALIQEDFGGGIFRGRRAPVNAVYDAVNALVDDERQLFRRGGSVYKSNGNAASALLGLWEGHVRAGQRTLFWTSGSLYALAADDATPSLLAGSTAGQPPSAWASGVELGGFVYFAAGQGSSGGKLYPREVFYAGSLKTASYSTGTASTTAGSKTVTGAGTSWLANVDAGMLLYVLGTLQGIVQSVETDTSLTLLHPAPTTNAGLAYAAYAYGVRTDTSTTAPFEGQEFIHATAGQRLLRCVGNRVYFSAPVDSDTRGIAAIAAYETDYHELPRGARVIGADSLNDTAILFTTAGVWAISNMAFDDLDDAGNQQHTVSQVTQDLILWGEAGIYGWGGALLVPAVDDVYLLALGNPPQPVSEGIRPLYREYVEAGYKPGTATVHRGHYFLPILDASNVLVDVLVCRLDLGSAWTRWDDHAAGGAYALRVGAGAREPKLLGLNGQRVTELTGCFDPDAARDDDADGTDHQFIVETRDFDLAGGNLKPGTAEKAELIYELEGTGATVAVSWASGEEGSSYTTVTAIRGGGESDGTDRNVWPVNKARRSVRLRIVQSGAAAKMILRRVAVRVRKSGV